MITVYKVLNKSYDGLTSLCVGGEHMLAYEPGKTLEHPNMFVFPSPEAAKSAYILSKYEALWKCETTQVKAAPRMVLKPYYVNVNVLYWFNTYWQSVQDGAPKWPDALTGKLEQPPEGTLLVGDLKLVREVPR